MAKVIVLLKEICLDNNLLDDTSFEHLLVLILHQASLSQIIILDNPFTSEGVAQFWRSLEGVSINSVLQKSFDQFYGYWDKLAQQQHSISHSGITTTQENDDVPELLEAEDGSQSGIKLR